MDTRLVHRYSQTTHLVQDVTEFHWILHNLALLKDLVTIHSKKFSFNGSQSSQCQLSLTTSERLQFSFNVIEDIPLIIITVYINGQKLSNHTLHELNYSKNKPQLEVPLKVARMKMQLTDEFGSKEKDIHTITVELVLLRYSSGSLCTNSATNVSEKIRSMYTDKILCDVTFLIGEKELVAHRNILAAHSKVFEAMFLVEMAEKNEGRVRIVDISATIFEKFLNYLYFGEVDNLHEIVEEMVGVADKYQVAELKTLCQNYMVQNLSSENAFKYIDIAEKFCCAELKTEALNFLRNDDGILATVFKKENLEEITILKKMLSDSSQN